MYIAHNVSEILYFKQHRSSTPQRLL